MLMTVQHRYFGTGSESYSYGSREWVQNREIWTRPRTGSEDNIIAFLRILYNIARTQYLNVAIPTSWFSLKFWTSQTTEKNFAMNFPKLLASCAINIARSLLVRGKYSTSRNRVIDRPHEKIFRQVCIIIWASSGLKRRNLGLKIVNLGLVLQKLLNNLPKTRLYLP